MVKSNPKKIESSIVGEFIDLYYCNRFTDKERVNIIIKCFSEFLNYPVEEMFNYSMKWQKLNLVKGDKVKFNGTIYETISHVHVTKGTLDKWRSLPPHLSKEIKIYDIKRVKQITKL